MSLLSILFWLAGILGVGGLAVLYVFAHAIAQVVVAAIAALVKATFSTRLGVGAVMLAAGLIAGELHADSGAEAACQARMDARDLEWQAREAQAAALYNAARAKRDADVAAAIAAKNADRDALIGKLVTDLQQKVDRYEKDTPKALAACRVTQRTLDRRDRLLGVHAK